MTAYQSIACVQHEQLEFAVLQHQYLQLHYLDAQAMSVVVTVLPLDVYSANAAEWLEMQHADGRIEVVRLDALPAFTAVG